MSNQEHIAKFENKNSHSEAQGTRLSSHPAECSTRDLVPRDIRLLTELEHLEALGKGLTNGCLFRCHIESGKLENLRKEQQWANHIYLSFASSSWEKLCNISTFEVMQDISSWLTKIYPIDRMNVLPSLYKSLIKCTPFNAEVRYYYSDTETRWLQILIQPFKDGEWVVGNGFILDVTDRKHAEDNLIAEKRRLQMLGNNLPNGVLYRLVFNRVTMKMSMEYVSSTWERITGISTYSVTKDIKAFLDIIHPDDLPFFLEVTEISKQKTTTLEVEVRINHKGNIRWLHISAQPYKAKEMVIWDGIITDITRRKKVEDELAKYREELEYLVKERTEELEATNEELAKKNIQLREQMAARVEIMQQLENSETKLRNFIQQSLEGIMIFDQQGKVTEWNNGMEKITGYEKSMALGKFEWEMQWQLYPEEHRSSQVLDDLHRKRLEYMGGDHNLDLVEDFTIHTCDGEARHVNMSMFAIKMNDLRNYGCIMRDVTRQRNANIELSHYRASLEKMVEMKTRELVIAKEKAEESDRLKSAFLANMSHEVRTPLNAISSLLNILAGDTQLPDSIREYIDIITNNGEQLLKLIDDILDTAKIEAGQMIIRSEPFCIDDFMAEMAALFTQYLQNLGKAHISLENIKTSTGKCIVSTDPIRLMQIVHNLLSNAIKFTENGHIRFGYRLTDTNLIEFFVEDTGIGIPESHLDIIFQSFRQLELGNNRRYGGAGLGLSISQRLAQLMGGDMYVKSTEGEGSTFSFTIAYNPVH